MLKYKTPIVVVLGATGAGKSKLALELAAKFNGEIINSDVMQMYKGLDIVTNKVTEEELSKVKHHMIDFLDPISEEIRIKDFRDRSLPIITNLLENEKIPFICGGTHYYIESLLWNVLIENSNDETELVPSVTDDVFSKCIYDDDESIATDDLYKRLQEVDSERAQTLHKNNRRKIYRSLQVYYQMKGKTHSQFIKEQTSKSGHFRGGDLKFDNVCIIWVTTDQNVLNKRCDKRVEKMLQRGMLHELESFHRDYNMKRKDSTDYTRGIFQAIGFKEFHNYLILSDEEKKSEKGQKLYKDGIEAMNNVTHRYAKSQIRWIRQRLLNPYNPKSNRIKLYAVDSTNPDDWDKLVLNPSINLVQSFINQTEETMSPVQIPDVPDDVSIEQIKKIYYCDVCDIHLEGIHQYNFHTAGKKHHAKLKKLKKEKFELSSSSSSVEDNYGLKLNFNGINREQISTDRKYKLKLIQLLKSVGKMSNLEVIRLLSDESTELQLKLSENEANYWIEKFSELNVDVEKISI